MKTVKELREMLSPYPADMFVVVDNNIGEGFFGIGGIHLIEEDAVGDNNEDGIPTPAMLLLETENVDRSEDFIR